MNLIEKIKEKRELSYVDDALVREYIEEYFKRNPGEKEKVEAGEKKAVKKILKSVRNSLRLVYGSFLSRDYLKMDEKLDELKKKIDTGNTEDALEMHKEILRLHASTRERLSFYKDFFEEIFALTGKPSSILDIGAGLNPVAYPFMGLSDVEYNAYELNSKDAAFIQKYFDIMKIDGKAEKMDITKDVPSVRADVCFALKLVDIVDNKTVERVVRGLDVKFIAASFPTKTVSLRRMNVVRRGGFQRMLARQGLSYEKIEFENELVYVIKK
ncbi:hypothetical protein GF336_03365 [Candidatus Woesearchaeota archaeon]|nr:hypothetical protein [Candidatus Woesearchaeota archaeon]